MCASESAARRQTLRDDSPPAPDGTERAELHPRPRISTAALVEIANEWVPAQGSFPG